MSRLASVEILGEINMTLAQFEREVLVGDRVGKNDQIWFPRWLRRYGLSFRNGLIEALPVNRHAVIRFSRSLLNNGAPAWQRWQAVKAIECYRDLVLERSEPDLSEITSTLARLGRQERNIDLHEPPTAEEIAKLRGSVNR